jgi:hypothetical protein
MSEALSRTDYLRRVQSAMNDHQEGLKNFSVKRDPWYFALYAIGRWLQWHGHAWMDFFVDGRATPLVMSEKAFMFDWQRSDCLRVSGCSDWDEFLLQRRYIYYQVLKTIEQSHAWPGDFDDATRAAVSEWLSVRLRHEYFGTELVVTLPDDVPPDARRWAGRHMKWEVQPASSPLLSLRIRIAIRALALLAQEGSLWEPSI